MTTPIAATAPFEATARGGARSLIFPAVFLLLTLGTIAPIVHNRFLPLVDLPQHAAQVALWRAHETNAAVHEHYTIHLAASYVGAYILWNALVSAGLTILDAGRVVTGVCLVAVPCSLLLLLRARGRPREWSLLAFPMLYNHALGFGFLPFYLTISLFFFGVALFSMWLAKGGARWGLVAAAGGLVVLWGHGLTAGFWGITCGLLAVLRPGSIRHRLAGLLPTIPTGLLLLAWTATLTGGEPQSALGDFRDRAGRLAPYLVRGFTPSVRTAEQAIIYVAIAGLILSLISAWRSPRLPGLPGMVRGFDGALLLSGLAAFALYFVLPSDMLTASVVNSRFVPFGFLLLVASLPPIRWRWPRVAVGAAAVATSLIVFARLDSAFVKFNQEVGQADALFARFPAGASVVRPDGPGPDDYKYLDPFYVPVLDHFATWAQTWTLGPATGFTDVTHILVQDSRQNPAPRPGARLVTDSGGHASIESMGRPLPDFLVFRAADDVARVLPVAGGAWRYEWFGQSGHLHAFRLSAGRE